MDNLRVGGGCAHRIASAWDRISVGDGETSASAPNLPIRLEPHSMILPGFFFSAAVLELAAPPEAAF